MDSLQSIKKRLIEHINRYQAQDEEISCVRIQSKLSVNLLSWLKAQSNYPQFYLNFRDDAQIVATIGEVRCFDDTKAAQRFMQETQLPLFGGLTFYAHAGFFLPRLVLQQQNDELSVSLFIDNGKKNPTEERKAIAALLETFEKITALQPVRQQIRLTEQKAAQDQWCQWVEKALQRIRSGELTKVVLANETVFRTQNPLNPKDFLVESERCNFGCYHFLLQENPRSAFLGSTPERLYRRQGLLLQTEALAGTALMCEDEEQNRRQGEWLLQDPKNLYENWLVVEDISQNLQPYVRDIVVADSELKQLRQVQHLKRKIHAELLPDYGDVLCLDAIHPTAAVAGLPRDRAVRFLAETESFNRGRYAGAVGVMAPDCAEFCVAIRSAFIAADKIHVFAGAGIVEGSIPLLEWQEIERKALGLVSLLQE
ncbi:isochorismate synthase [Caviibacterium pharyngocola]|uniref:Isochorismate synthase MenF n=1 Tax=Caviibacterium pharyngocola TaxID=28159 RepID=A0A2M8RY96_9PAST|nr:isochorismate synthase [Caviibacterium pharyngocola]PJG83852.1 isochorismate synthase [Caviibacterium pharyngocola]